MEFCRKIGCEPMICVNFGSGTAEEAANWVEYCNGCRHAYGRLRAATVIPNPGISNTGISEMKPLVIGK